MVGFAPRSARGWPSPGRRDAPAWPSAGPVASSYRRPRTRLARREQRGRHRVERAATVLEVLDVLVAEVLDGRLDRRDRTVGQRAERPAADVVAQVQQQLEI